MGFYLGRVETRQYFRLVILPSRLWIGFFFPPQPIHSCLMADSHLHDDHTHTLWPYTCLMAMHVSYVHSHALWPFICLTTIHTPDSRTTISWPHTRLMAIHMPCGYSRALRSYTHLVTIHTTLFVTKLILYGHTQYTLWQRTLYFWHSLVSWGRHRRCRCRKSQWCSPWPRLQPHRPGTSLLTQYQMAAHTRKSPASDTRIVGPFLSPPPPL